ncbi:hypothetical protein GCM10009087_55390 [Sphingomonas oligophenolica]
MPGGPPRRSFALLGPSVVFDPLTNAVRRDVADIRLADRVFAPHYAAPMPRRVAVEASLLGSTEQEAPILAMLRPGEIFEVLDLAGGNAWGIAVAHNLVGYVDAGALELAQ